FGDGSDCKTTAACAVPEMSPVLGSRLRPFGSWPCVTLQANGDVPPVTASCKLYDWPMVTGGICAGAVTWGSGAIVTVMLAVFEVSETAMAVTVAGPVLAGPVDGTEVGVWLLSAPPPVGVQRTPAFFG